MTGIIFTAYGYTQVLRYIKQMGAEIMEPVCLYAWCFYHFFNLIKRTN